MILKMCIRQKKDNVNEIMFENDIHAFYRKYRAVIYYS